MSYVRHIIGLFLFTVLLHCIPVQAQNNVGIGTQDPHISALLHLADTAKGLVIPRTDTTLINNYVNSLVPPQSVANGLIIYQENVHSYFFFHGPNNRWERLTNIVGPRGPTGPQGAMGVRGPTGRSPRWSDSTSFTYPEPQVSPKDSCGDFFYQLNTGLLWTFHCDSNPSGWYDPIARWRNLGPGIVQSERCTSLTFLPMPNSSANDTLSIIPGFEVFIDVPPDTVAYVEVTCEGTIQKRFASDSTFNYAKFDFFMRDTAGVGSYLNHSQTVVVNPNGPPKAGETVGRFDKVAWSITTSFTLKGKLSLQGFPLSPTSDKLTWSLEAHAGQLHTPGNPVGVDSDLILNDAGAGKNGMWENNATFHVYIIYERNKDALLYP